MTAPRKPSVRTLVNMLRGLLVLSGWKRLGVEGRLRGGAGFCRLTCPPGMQATQRDVRRSEDYLQEKLRGWTIEAVRLDDWV
jgi:hypothetical protein